MVATHNRILQFSVPIAFVIGVLVGILAAQRDSNSADARDVFDAPMQEITTPSPPEPPSPQSTPTHGQEGTATNEEQEGLLDQITAFARLRGTGYFPVRHGLFLDSGVNPGILHALGFDKGKSAAVKEVLVEHLAIFDALAARNAKIVTHENGFHISVQPFLEGVDVHDRMLQAISRTLGAELGAAFQKAFADDIEERMIALCSGHTTYDIIILNDGRYQVTHLLGREFVYSATEPKIIEGQEALKKWVYPFGDLLAQELDLR